MILFACNDFFKIRRRRGGRDGGGGGGCGGGGCGGGGCGGGDWRCLLLFYELIDASFIDVCEKYDKFVCVIFVVQLKHLK